MSAGLIDYWREEFYQKIVKNPVKCETTPEKEFTENALNLRQFVNLFKLYFVAILITLLLFLWEYLFIRNKIFQIIFNTVSNRK